MIGHHSSIMKDSTVNFAINKFIKIINKIVNSEKKYCQKPKNLNPNNN